MHCEDSMVRCLAATASSFPSSCGAAGMSKLFSACTYRRFMRK